MDQTVRAAGAAAVDVNAPMGADRVAEIAAWIAADDPGVVLDLGCGRGALAVAVAGASGPATQVTGIDIDPEAIAAGRERAAAEGVEDRCTFVEGDAAAETGPADATVCIASSHIFGGAQRTLDRMLDLTRPGGMAVLGDGVWATTPDSWCRETFGDLPTRDDLVAMAAQIGWDVEDVDGSTVQEWDDFESGWTAGVEAVGTAEARSFAAQRRDEYAHYRGVLGFAWLLLRRPV